MERDVPTIARRARMKGLCGDFSGAHALLDEADQMVSGEPGNDAHCQIERGRLYHSSGLKAQSLGHFLRAWDLARRAKAHSLAVDAAHMIAIASPLPDAEGWTRVALDYTSAHPGTEHWRGILHNNLGWIYFNAGRHFEAMMEFEDALIFYSEFGNAADIRVARYAIVRTLRAQGRHEAAIDLAESLLSDADMHGDTAPYVCEELAELYHAAGDPELACEHASRALVTLSRDRAFTNGHTSRYQRLRDLAGEAHMLMRM